MSLEKKNSTDLNNYKSIVENLPVAVVILTFEGKVLYSNKKAFELVGVEENEINNVNVFDFVTPQFLKIVKERKTALSNGEELPLVEIEAKKKDGTIFFVEIKSSAIIYNGVQAIQTIITDVTLRKQLHDEKTRIQIIEETNKALKKEVVLRKHSEEKLMLTQSQLAAIINTADDIIFSIDKEYKISEFNETFKRVVKIRNGMEIKSGMYVLDILPENNKEYLKPKYDKALKGENVLAIEKFLMLGREHTYEAHYNPIIINGVVTGVAIFSKDITEQHEAQQNLFNKQSQLTTIINTTRDIIFSMDKNYCIVQYNDVIKEIAELRSEKKLESGMSFFDFLPKEMHSQLKETYDKALNGESIVNIETFLHPRTQENRTYEANYNPIIINKKIVGISVFSRDITEQKEVEQNILNTQSQLSAIINNTTDIVVSIDRNYNIVQFNKLLADMLKQRNGLDLQVGSSVFQTMSEEHHEDMKNIYKRVFAEGKGLVAVEIFSSAGQKKRYFESNYNPIKQGNKTIGIAIFSRDITEKIESENELRETLREKEVLLKEVHHRVKNNLQVISSILNLQTSYVKDKETANVLKECQNRIKTMAYIHESLYQTKDFSQINFSEYIINLVKNLFYSYDANQQKIKTFFDIDPIFLNLDISIPCGLIINELVSNALKYAFTGGLEGCITVKVKKDKKNKIKMTVADNGKGLPDNVDYKNTETLGLQLVTILAEQISGTLTIKRTKGTTFEIIF